ncbi:Mediator of RNA polymerase II transcription subunit 26 [Frankliniella fusca]|uniref:Mediator of RNA polymerase II transcription subunit 26 n=1 Tax=Frankliniella fusca TaxID=407009 RepID=A0AAE1HSM9_9NEOP|nr:Mediator of RNA polymerase II transcription subunit 26 [Frankliniella fusca]
MHSNTSVWGGSTQFRALHRSPGRHDNAARHHELPTYPLPPPPPPPLPLPARTTPASPAAEPLPPPVMQAEASSASSTTYLHRALPGPLPGPLSGPLSGPRPGPDPLDMLTGTPSSFSYFMQVQPHPRATSYRERTRQTSHVVNLLPHGGTREQDPAPQRAPFSGTTFQSFPFGPIQVPSAFTHPNPLAVHHRRPPAPAGAADDYSVDAPPVGFVETASYMGGRLQEGVMERRPPRPSAPRRRRPKAKQQTKPKEITILGDPRRPNLGIVGVPGQDVYEPAPPRIREYDPYTGRFKVLTPDEAHDSREEYRRPGASAETSAEAGDAGHQSADVGEEQREDESYEVYETPDETHSLVPMRAPRGRASGCLQKDFLTGLLSPLINAIRPAIKQCQRQQRLRQPQQQQQYGRLHRPRGRPRKRPAKQSKQQQAQHAQRAREPYFEFRNPVHNYISGEPQGRGLEEVADGDADAEYLSVGEAEREARAPPRLREELSTEDDKSEDDGVFAPYSVYRTVLEPDRKFRPFVRFPFESERSNLKAMVNDLIHEGTAPP